MQTLIIKKFKIKNALCFDELEVDFTQDPVTQIIGENGVGKSSIPTLLEECLYNKNSKGLAKGDLVNRYSEEKGYRLGVTFSKGGTEYMVQKIVTSSAKVVLSSNGEDISGHTATQTYKVIQEIIGLDFQTFSKLCYQSMESSLDFLKATDANRKKFFMSLFNLSEYSETEEKLKAAHSATKKELDTAKTKMDTVRTWLDQTRRSERQEEREVKPLDIEGLQDTVTSVTADIKNIAVNNALAKEELDKRAHLARMQKIKVAPCHDNSEQLKLSTRAYEEQNKLNIQLQTKHRLAKASADKAMGYEETCSKCGQDLDFSQAKTIYENALGELSNAEEDMSIAISKLTQFQHILKEDQQEQKAYREYVKHTETLEAAENAVDISKPTEILEVDELQTELRKLQLEIQMRQDDYEADIRFNQNVAINNAKCDAEEQQRVRYQEELALYSSKLTQISEIESDLKILKESFSGKGLVNFKIESLIKGFENEINNNLIKLTDGQFALGFNIEDSKLKLKIYSHSEEVSIKSLSTGEFNKVNMASLLAVRNMMAKLSDVSVNVLFLDEVISVLSPNSLETLIEHLLAENLNTFIVSHGYAHPLAEEIHLEKTNNISKRI